jgi:hypothetical protein
MTDKMFGRPYRFVNENLFAGLHKQSAIFRLPAADRADFPELDGSGDFKADPLDRKRAVLAQWIERSLAFTRFNTAEGGESCLGKESE